MKRLLLIDPSVEYRTLWASFLADQGFDVRTARSGEEALAQLDNGTEPDLILLDLHLRGVDGISVLHDVLERPEPIPVIALSAESRSGINLLPAAEAIGAVKGLCKPLPTETLLEEITAILDWQPQEPPVGEYCLLESGARVGARGGT